MDFARKQLMKFGWTEGKGLGKNEDGISVAIKPKLKFDTTGVGHDSSEQFTFNWWENVFNNAADNINVGKSNEGNINITLNTDESVNITTKKYSLKNKTKKSNSLEYGCFLKTEKLTAEGVVEHEEKVTVPVKQEVLKTVNLTDEQLFEACGGRTAHKGARHGFKLNGKLARLEQQEQYLLQKLYGKTETQTKESSSSAQSLAEFPKIEDIDENMPHKSKKKKKKSKSKESSDEYFEIESDTNKETRRKKKCKRKRDKSASKELNNTDEELELEANQKRCENFCDIKIRTKKRSPEEKAMSKMSRMFKKCDLNKPEKSDDDGFEELVKPKKIKLMYEEEPSKRKKHKKDKHTEDLPFDGKEKKKIKKHKNRTNESLNEKKKLKKYKKLSSSTDDAGFCELMNEINEKLESSKELKKKIKKQKKKHDEERIRRISEEFDKVSM